MCLSCKSDEGWKEKWVDCVACPRSFLVPDDWQRPEWRCKACGGEGGLGPDTIGVRREAHKITEM